MPNDQHELIGTAEAARLRGVDMRTIQRWAASGVLEPVVKIPGRTGAYLFNRSDIEEPMKKSDAAA